MSVLFSTEDKLFLVELATAILQPVREDKVIKLKKMELALLKEEEKRLRNQHPPECSRERDASGACPCES